MDVIIMTDNIVNIENSDLPAIPASNVVIESNTNSDAANASLQQAATALVQYVQAIAPSSTTTASDSTDVLHEIATSFMQQTAAAISTGATAVVSPQSSISDSAVPTNLNQASSTFVEHLGDLLVNPNASDTVSSVVLMQDVQEIWKNKSTTDTVVSTASSIWESVKSSQHLPVIAGMLASVIFKKK